jgi:tRNA A37 methylthiotransferase MiaB
MGRTRTNRIVNASGPENLAGKLASVRITGATANSLIGELLWDKPILNSQLEGERA